MSQTTAKAGILVYTEATPNPENLKFVTNKVLLPHESVDFPDETAAQQSPMAAELFTFPFVRGVFIANNFVTITKTPETNWHEVMPSLRDFVRNYAASGKAVVEEAYLNSLREKRRQEHADTDDETKIKQLLDKYVRPAVEMDGGAIIFDSYEDGIVKLQMQGSCSGCPSSTVTLKAGIEGLLKRMMPEIQGVEAIEA